MDQNPSVVEANSTDSAMTAQLEKDRKAKQAAYMRAYRASKKLAKGVIATSDQSSNGDPVAPA